MSEQLMRKWTEGFAAADWDKVASTYADDVIGSDPTGSTYEGKEANLENDKGWRSTFLISTSILKHLIHQETQPLSNLKSQLQ